MDAYNSSTSTLTMGRILPWGNRLAYRNPGYRVLAIAWSRRQRYSRYDRTLDQNHSLCKSKIPAGAVHQGVKVVSRSSTRPVRLDS